MSVIFLAFGVGTMWHTHAGLGAVAKSFRESADMQSRTISSPTPVDVKNKIDLNRIPPVHVSSNGKIDRARWQKDWSRQGNEVFSRMRDAERHRNKVQSQLRKTNELARETEQQRDQFLLISYGFFACSAIAFVAYIGTTRVARTLSAN